MFGFSAFVSLVLPSYSFCKKSSNPEPLFSHRKFWKSPTPSSVNGCLPPLILHRCQLLMQSIPTFGGSEMCGLCELWYFSQTPDISLISHNPQPIQVCW